MKGKQIIYAMILAVICFGILDAAGVSPTANGKAGKKYNHKKVLGPGDSFDGPGGCKVVNTSKSKSIKIRWYQKKKQGSPIEHMKIICESKDAEFTIFGMNDNVILGIKESDGFQITLSGGSGGEVNLASDGTLTFENQDHVDVLCGKGSDGALITGTGNFNDVTYNNHKLDKKCYIHGNYNYFHN